MSNKFKIELFDNISKTVEDKMRRGFEEYESSHDIEVNYKTFSLVLKNEAGEVIGVLNAYTVFAEIYIDDIWIDKENRGKGYGKLLLTELENRFNGQGFNNMNLVTNAFQAPTFYEKCGFTPEFVRVNKINPKLSKTFFIKYFDDEVQMQGIKSGKS
jgi:ribosomal protein S18 acetylase RimI-like enzyme